MVTPSQIMTRSRMAEGEEESADPLPDTKWDRKTCSSVPRKTSRLNLKK